jgi:hypothetical protein
MAPLKTGPVSPLHEPPESQSPPLFQMNFNEDHFFFFHAGKVIPQLQQVAYFFLSFEFIKPYFVIVL